MNDSTKPTILVVDDHEASLFAVKALLEPVQADVRQARSGVGALDQLLAGPVDVAILDVRMPDMDGFELAEIMRSSPRTREVPIIFLTGNQELGRAFRGYEAGAVDYLIKPADPLVLRSKVAVFLELSASRRQLAKRVEELERALESERSARRAAEEAEAARLESEERFRTLADNIAPLTWMADEKGSIFWYSKRWFEYTGTTLEEMRGEGWQSSHHPEHVGRVVEKARRCFARGEPWDDTFPLRGKDGQYRWFLSRAVPIRDAAGRVVRWFGANTDVTELLEAQAAARQERDFSAALLDTAGALVLVLDREGRIERFNRACERISGYAFEEVRGRSYEFLVPEEQREPLREVLTAILMGKFPETHENEWLTEGGHRRLISWSDTALTGCEGRVEHIIATGVDITERHLAEVAMREANAQLREADHRKNEFIAVLSHELRNPLAPIRNSVYILERATPGGEQAKRARQVIDRQAQHLTRLIDDLLDVTRITRGKIVLRRERLDINELVQATSEDHRALFVERSIDLIIRSSDQPLWVDGDATRLAQVIGNLLSNSAKFTPPGGKATVSVEAEGQRQVVVRVRDSGTGMSKETLAHIFEPFMQAAQSLDRSRGGLGLGLALTKGLVEMHGGTVVASSDGEGKGSEFVVTLPVHGTARPGADGRETDHRPAAP